MNRPGATLHFLDFTLDPENAQLRRGTQAIPIRPKTFETLLYLAERAGRLVTKAELLDGVWAGAAVGEWVLAGCVQELRRLLADDARQPRVIETVHRRGYRFIAPISDAASVHNPEAPPAAPLLPGSVRAGRITAGAAIVGRDTELEELQAWLSVACAGERQIGFIVGEAGIGKTTLVDAFFNAAATRFAQPAAACFLAFGQCLEHHGGGDASAEPYLPVLEALERLLLSPPGAALRPILQRYAPSWLALLPALVDAPASTAPRPAVTTHQRMLHEMAAFVAAVPAPLVIVIEDLHWSDAATVDLLAALAQRRDPAPLLIIATYRPVEVAVRSHSLKDLHHELRAHGRCRDLWLGCIGAPAVTQYLLRRFRDLDAAPTLAALIVERTDGNPLFVVNVVDHLVATQALAQVDGRWQLTAATTAVAHGIPPGLRQLIATQIDRLAAAERAALETGSLAGATFSAAVVAAALGADLVQVEACLERLTTREQVVRAAGESVWPDATVAGQYQFIHSVYQDVLRQRVPPARRQRLHQAIAARLEAGHRGQVESIATELAFHFEAGGEPERAVPYLEDAAAHAVRCGAEREAAAQLEHGLRLLDALPRTPERTLRAVRLYMDLGVALQPLHGFAGAPVETAFARARALSEELDDPVQLFQALAALSGVHVGAARCAAAAETAARLEELMRRLPLPLFQMGGQLFIGMVRYSGGDLAEARARFEQVLGLETLELPAGPIDYLVHALNYLALTLLQLGYPDQARARSRQSMGRAAGGGPPFDRGSAATFACHVGLQLRDRTFLEPAAQAAARIGGEYGFAMPTAIGAFAGGWLRASAGELEAGVAEMESGIEQYRISGQVAGLPGLLSMLADVCVQAGCGVEAQRHLTSAVSVAAATGEVRFVPEMERLKGILRSLHNDDAAAERHFTRAIAIAQQQGSRWWELRATASLVRLRQQRGAGEALRPLAQLLGTFHEGFDLPDVRDAQALCGAKS